MKKLSVNTKIIIAVVSFVILFIIISLVFVLFNNSNNQPNPNNTGGTGGDYTPANIVIIANDGILYDSVGSSNTSLVEDLLQKAVLYNISISNDPSASSAYLQSSDFNIETAKYFKSGKSYSAKIDNGDISSPSGVPWNYQFTTTTNDNRHFKVLMNVNPDLDTGLISVQKLD